MRSLDRGFVPPLAPSAPAREARAATLAARERRAKLEALQAQSRRAWETVRDAYSRAYEARRLGDLAAAESWDARGEERERETPGAAEFDVILGDDADWATWAPLAAKPGEIVGPRRAGYDAGWHRPVSRETGAEIIASVWRDESNLTGVPVGLYLDDATFVREVG